MNARKAPRGGCRQRQRFIKKNQQQRKFRKKPQRKIKKGSILKSDSQGRNASPHTPLENTSNDYQPTFEHTIPLQDDASVERCSERLLLIINGMLQQKRFPTSEYTLIK